jgi:antitoxin component of MazEF toxin-antitoxin module
MHKIKESCSFMGDELSLEARITALRSRQAMGKAGRGVWETEGDAEKTVWESAKRADNNPDEPAIRMDIFTAKRVLHRVEISQVVSGKTIMTTFDGSCNLVRYDSGSKESGWENLAGQLGLQQGKQLPAFIAGIGFIQNPKLPKDSFYRYAMITKDQPPENLRLGEVYFFEETTPIQQSKKGSYSVCVPKHIADAMGLKKGSQVMLRLEEGRVTVELMKEHVAKIYKSGGSLVVPLYSNLLKAMESVKDDPLKWYLPDATRARRVGHGPFQLILSREAIDRNNLKDGDYVELVMQDRELVVKPVPAREQHLSKVSERKDPLRSEMEIGMHKELSYALDKAGWVKGARVGFKINEQGWLVIYPKQG